MTAYQIDFYCTKTQKFPFHEWFSDLNDKKTKSLILTRLDRIRNGAFGDCKFLRDGVWEIKIDYGAGYRLYYGMIGKTAILLLLGGDKRKQNSDIERAVQYFTDYKFRRKI